MQTTQIFMPLLNEGMECWRPVEALALGGNLFCVVSHPDVEEAWKHPHNAVVLCEPRIFADGETGWVACALGPIHAGCQHPLGECNELPET